MPWYPSHALKLVNFTNTFLGNNPRIYSNPNYSTNLWFLPSFKVSTACSCPGSHLALGHHCGWPRDCFDGFSKHAVLGQLGGWKPPLADSRLFSLQLEVLFVSINLFHLFFWQRCWHKQCEPVPGASAAVWGWGAGSSDRADRDSIRQSC